MRTIKLTKEQYHSIRKPLPVRHVACKPRESTQVVSESTFVMARPTALLYGSSVDIKELWWNKSH